MSDEAVAAPSSEPPLVAIEGFFQDDEGHWVARLVCGHTQHVRHAPPRELRPWVTTEEGRAQKVGAELGCRLCLAPRLPEGVVEYKRTTTFDEHTVPKGLLRSHTTKAGTWAEIVVERGFVVYVLEDRGDAAIVLREGVPGVVAPEAPHRVDPRPGARFYVRFLRLPER